MKVIKINVFDKDVQITNEWARDLTLMFLKCPLIKPLPNGDLLIMQNPKVIRLLKHVYGAFAIQGIDHLVFNDALIVGSHKEGNGYKIVDVMSSPDEIREQILFANREAYQDGFIALAESEELDLTTSYGHNNTVH